MKLYLPPGVTEHTVSTDLFISSASVTLDGGYDLVRIWMHGKLAGFLLMDIGEGETFLQKLGLEPHDCPRCGRPHDSETPKPKDAS